MTLNPVRRNCVTGEEKGWLQSQIILCIAMGPADLDPDPPTFHADFRPAWSPWTYLVIPGLCLALAHPTRPDPDPDLRIDLWA